MSKKILKRSLALGALMAFVITGSAYAESYNEDVNLGATDAKPATGIQAADWDVNINVDMGNDNWKIKNMDGDGINGGQNSLITIENGKTLDIEAENMGIYTSEESRFEVETLKILAGHQAMSVYGKTDVIAKNVDLMVNNGHNVLQINEDLNLGSDNNHIGLLSIGGENYSRAIRVSDAVANIYADTLNISGATESSKVTGGGTLNLSANAGKIVSDFEAGEDGTSKGTVNLTLDSGVTLTGSVVTDTASESASNITLNGATWNVTGDSNISTLAGNDGKIVLGLRNEPAAAAYSLRSTGNNNAFYGLQIGDLTNSNLEVSGGAELTEAIENGTVDMTAEEALQQLADAVTVTGEDSQEQTVSKVTVEAGDTLGETTATITANGTIASITQDVNPKAAKVSKAATNLKAHYRAHMNDMNKRMGELRMANGEAGVWTRMVRGESEYQDAKMQYNQYQLGYDEKLSVDKRWTVGAAVTFAEGDGSYGQGSTDDKSTAFAIYGTKLNNDGTFVDLIARYAHLESDMEDSVYGNGDYSTNGYSVSAEFGKRIQQGNGLWIEPQVELTYGTIDSADFRLKNGSEEYNANFDSMDSFIARVGFSIGKDIKEGNVYARASYLYDFDGETTSLVTKNGIGTPTPEDFGGGWWEVGVGANINLSKATYIYADIEKTFGGEVDTNWQWNLGVRYSF